MKQVVSGSLTESCFAPIAGNKGPIKYVQLVVFWLRKKQETRQEEEEKSIHEPPH
jgi:hypothetical protein